MKIINPVTEKITEISETDIKTIPENIIKLKNGNWKNFKIEERQTKLEKIIQKLDTYKEKLAHLISEEMGKPYNLALIEVQRSIAEAMYFIENSVSFLQKTTAPAGYVVYEPLGVVAVISPWNFPVMLPLRSIIPALVAGNSVVFKPSEYTVKTSIELSKLFDISELKDSFFTVVGGKEHGKKVVESEVNLIAFTGSTSAGKHIFQTAAQNIKHVLLELGGLDSAIVLSDIDIKKTAALILQGNTANSGQVCNAIKRVYILEEIYDEFLKEIVNLSINVSIGEPNQNFDMGPVVSLEQLNRIQSFVDDAIEKGAIIHSGGKRLQRTGYFYPSTIISNLSSEMKLLNEECFGPVLPIIPVKNWQEAVVLSNNTSFGLAASVWTKDLKLAEEIALKLEVGGVHINSAFAGGPGTPWGGSKESGIGRQKTKESLFEYCNIKYIKVS